MANVESIDESSIDDLIDMAVNDGVSLTALLSCQNIQNDIKKKNSASKNNNLKHVILSLVESKKWRTTECIKFYVVWKKALLQAISINPLQHSEQVLEALISDLSLSSEKDEIASKISGKRICETVIDLIRLVPTSANHSLIAVLRRNFPYHTHSRETHIRYVEGLLELALKLSLWTFNILEIIFQRVLLLDFELQKIGDLQETSRDNHAQNLNLLPPHEIQELGGNLNKKAEKNSMLVNSKKYLIHHIDAHDESSDDENSEIIVSEEAAQAAESFLVARERHLEGMDTLDSLMCILINFIRLHVFASYESLIDTLKFRSFLLSFFETGVLATRASRVIQYLIYYYAIPPSIVFNLKTEIAHEINDHRLLLKHVNTKMIPDHKDSRKNTPEECFENGQQVADDFLGLLFQPLLSHLSSPNRNKGLGPTILDKLLRSVAFIGSFVSRAKFLKPKILHLALHLMVRLGIRVRADAISRGTIGCPGPLVKATLEQIMTIVIFRRPEFKDFDFNSTDNASKFKEKNQNADSKNHCGETLEAILQILIPDDLHLRYCDPQIVEPFLALEIVTLPSGIVDYSRKTVLKKDERLPFDSIADICPRTSVFFGDSVYLANPVSL